ncbi:MAG: LysM peptidoglycan-binding domain-containing protein [Anaerolineales bacterium]
MKAKFLIQILILAAFVMGAFLPSGEALAASSCGTQYTVKSGDTLLKIARLCGTTLSALRLANPEVGSGNLIRVGQKLYLPGAMIGDTLYVIARGDTLRSLATRFGTTVDALLKVNPNITNANRIYEGQRLVLPGKPGDPPVPPPPPPGGKTYTVQKGDTLRKIAEKHNTTWQEILKVNPQITNANLIYVGQVINLPAEVTNHVVQKGDTLNKIAAKYGTTLDKLLGLNPTITNANKIYVGQVIRVR